MAYIGDYDYYRERGFKEHELWLIRKTDCMLNNWSNLTKVQKERYWIMTKYLGL